MAEYDGELAQVLDQEVTAERNVLMVVALKAGIGGDLVKVKEGSTKCVPGVPGKG